MYNNENLSYYDFIMGSSDESMNIIFHKKWIEFLDELEVPYSKAIQLRIGNHLRPILVYWGNAIGSESIDAICVNVATEVAICVEIMHKTSIIIDDLIDADEKRHNRAAFHTQYSPEETIIFAIYFLGKAFYKMNELSSHYPNLKNISMNIFSKTLCIMASGCLQELTLTENSRYDIQAISNIMCMETSALIKNSALLGFSISRTPNTEQMNLLNDIGDKIGFLFQTMNDLEPFCSYENISLHKGSFNIDFERSRKNLVVPYIYGMCSTKEKQRLKELKNSPEAIAYMLQLYKKYNIFDIIQNDLENTKNQVELLINQLETQQINKQCLDEFRRFFTEILKVAYEKLVTYNTAEID